MLRASRQCIHHGNSDPLQFLENRLAHYGEVWAPPPPRPDASLVHYFEHIDHADLAVCCVHSAHEAEAEIGPISRQCLGAQLLT